MKMTTLSVITIMASCIITRGYASDLEQCSAWDDEAVYLCISPMERHGILTKNNESDVYYTLDKKKLEVTANRCLNTGVLWVKEEWSGNVSRCCQILFELSLGTEEWDVVTMDENKAPVYRWQGCPEKKN